MDYALQNLRRSYLKNGDYETGLSLLGAYVRNGIIPYRYVELAAVYRYPMAIDLVGPRKEGDVLPRNWNDFTDWPCEVYIRRNYATAKLAYEEVRNGLGLEEDTHETIVAALRCVESNLRNDLEDVDQDEVHRLFSETINLTQDYLNYSGSVDPAISNLIKSVGASVNYLSCLDDPSTVKAAISGTTWAAASLAFLDDALGRRDPSLPESPSDGFGPDVMDRIYIAIQEGLVPWLLDPFPT